MRRDLPEYATCDDCDEYATAALRRVDEQILCANCLALRPGIKPTRRCAICRRLASCERHHVASERQLGALILVVCLTCHAILSAKQHQWDPTWLHETHQLRCLIQGITDVLCLWFERSPVVEDCRDLFNMLGQAALYILGSLRWDALAELTAVRLSYEGD